MKTTKTYQISESLMTMIKKEYPEYDIYSKYIDYNAIVNFMLMEIKHAEHRYSQIKE